MLGADNNPDLNKFFARLKKRAEDLAQKGISDKLKEYITQEDLKFIYDALIAHEVLIREGLTQIDPNSTARNTLRVAKKGDENLPRTINIKRDLNGEYVLILETKSKLASGKKNPKAVKFSGTSKTGKPSWRIDTKEPQAFATLVSKEVNKEKLGKETDEAILSVALYQAAKKQASNDIPPINYSLIGTEYQKESEYKKEGKKVKGLVWKQALHSPMALGTLEDIFNNPKKFPLKEEDKNRIAAGLLHAIKILHDQGITHQDIKDKNVLVYKDENGYYVKLTDFGISSPTGSDELTSLATYPYASPEIFFAHRQKKDSMYKYYYEDNVKYPTPYGKYCDDALSKSNTSRLNDDNLLSKYKLPDPSNDMWAAGVLLYEVYTGKKLEEQDPKTLDLNVLGHLKELLEPDRSSRLTVDEAIAGLALLAKPIPKPEVITFKSAFSTIALTEDAFKDQMRKAAEIPHFDFPQVEQTTVQWMFGKQGDRDYNALNEMRNKIAKETSKLREMELTLIQITEFIMGVRMNAEILGKKFTDKDAYQSLIAADQYIKLCRKTLPEISAQVINIAEEATVENEKRKMETLIVFEKSFEKELEKLNQSVRTLEDELKTRKSELGVEATREPPSISG